MLILLIVWLTAAATGQQQSPVDPELQDLVARFFQAQQEEDVEAYLALRSTRADGPDAQEVRAHFEAENNTYTDIAIDRIVETPDLIRLRVSAMRMHTSLRVRGPDARPRQFTMRLQLGLAFVREGGEWKLLREGAPVEELAGALVDEADADARAALMRDEADLVTPALVSALARRGDVAIHAARYAAARTAYARMLEAARLLDYAPGEGQALQNLGNTAYFLREYSNALQLYEECLALARKRQDEPAIGEALVGVGTTRYATHDYLPALAAYREALAVQEKLHDQFGIAGTLISTGNVQYLQGDFEGAIADYQRAAELKRKQYDFGGAAAAVEGLGRTYAAQGDLDAALIAFQTVLEYSLKAPFGRRGSALQSIGEVHFRLGNLDQARASFDSSRREFERTKDLASAGRAWQGLALTELVAGRFDAAVGASTQSIQACSAVSDNECVGHALVGLGLAQASQEFFDQAVASYRKAVALLLEVPALEAAARARVGLAEALSRKGEHEGSLSESGLARQAAEALKNDDVLWRALVARSRAERRSGKAASALESASAALTVVRRMAQRSQDRPGYAPPADTTAAFTAAALLQAESGDAPGAFETLEQMHVHALRTALAPRERDIARGLTQEEREEERREDTRLATLHLQRDRQAALPKPDTSRLQELDEAIASETTSRRAARERRFARVPDLPLWRGLLTPVERGDLDTLLAKSGDVLLECALDQDGALFVIAERTDAGVVLDAHVVPLRRHAVAEQIAALVNPAAAEEQRRKAVDDLVRALPAELPTRLAAAQRLLIVPHDLLWRVPFEELLASIAPSAEPHGITYTGSMTALMRAPEPAPEAPALVATLFVAPDLPASLLDSLEVTAPSWRIRDPQESLREAELISRVFQQASGMEGRRRAAILSGAEASEERLREAAPQSSLLHIAAPFRVNAASPLFSSILLAGQNAGAGASVLEAREVPDLTSVPRTVLFTDPAALSMRDAGGAVPVLQWLWRTAGAEKVVLRRTAADQSPEGLQRLYEGLLKGESTWPSARGWLHLSLARDRAPDHLP